jgi:hypothetical protein
MHMLRNVKSKLANLYIKEDIYTLKHAMMMNRRARAEIHHVEVLSCLDIVDWRNIRYKPQSRWKHENHPKIHALIF